MKRGDHIYVMRKGGSYSHHGIDLGNGYVVHFTGEPGSKRDAQVEMTTKAEFLNGGREHVMRYNFYSAASPDVVVERALASVGDKGYNLAFNNCEHFATTCKHGTPVSLQVTGFALGVGLATLSIIRETTGRRR